MFRDTVMQNTPVSDWVVIKFGGTSVSTRQSWQNIASVIDQHLQKTQHLLVVCSAPSRVSNQLECLIEHAIVGNYHETLESIKSTYQVLADDLQLSFNDHVGAEFLQLQKHCEGITLLKEASPRIRAQVMSFGELSLTKLGAAFLKQQQQQISWQDARDYLKCQQDFLMDDTKAYLQAYCDIEADVALQSQLNAVTSPVLLTQGYIASNAQGDTVLLGRGGSDTSAAYFAAKCQARCCEIWTDVPGIYTANPQVIPEARFLKQLDYDEAQEIASMGAKVLHPNCIPPLKFHQIPLSVKYTPEPAREGTVISFESDSTVPQIKSILTRDDILLVSIESVKMWQQAGFLSAIFDCFKKYNVSVDLISTSEANVTVSLDRTVQLKDASILDALLVDLNSFAKANIIGPCASISLVGRNIRSILCKLGHVFEVFESRNIYLLSQASNDLNLTFVVDEDQSLRLLQRLHVLLIEENANNACFNRSWQEEFGQHQQIEMPWWQQQRDTLLQMMSGQSDLYVYSRSQLQNAADQLVNCMALDQCFYAMKANPNVEILKTFYAAGIGFECVSMSEVNCVFQLFPGIDRERILFTPNFAPKTEYAEALALGIHVTVDNLYPLQHWPELFQGHNILVRIDLGHGDGHHRYVCTAGSDSKFGIPLAKVDFLKALSQQHNFKIIGLHSHSGSGILNPDTWSTTARSLLDLTKIFEDVSIINVGGGLGVVERAGQQALDMTAVNDSLQQIKQQCPGVRLWMEPGRFLVARAGVLLARVTQIKDKDDIRFIGITTGMNSLIRPALYGAYHEIVNLTQLGEPNVQVVNVVGPICESGDTLGYSRLMPKTEEGDVLLIANVGAYGRAMSSRYNLREPAPELMV